MKCRLKELREKRGLNQVGMGMVLNVSQQTISRLERGSLYMPIDLVVRCAEFFDVTVDYFLGMSEEVTRPPQSSKVYYPNELQEEFLAVFEGLTPVHQQAVAGMVHELFMIQRWHEKHVGK